MSARPTLEQAHDALARLSPESLCGGPYACPVCDPDQEREPGLWLSQNGTGPHYDCKTTPRAEGCTPIAIDRMVAAVFRAMPAPAPASTLAEDTRASLEELLSGLKVARIHKQGRYIDIELDDGRVIEMGTASQMLNRRQFEANILEQVDILIDPHPVARHRQLVAGMVAIAERRDVATTADETIGWIAAYMGPSRGPAVDLADAADLRDVLLTRGRPFRTTDGRIGVTLNEMRNHVRRMSGDRLSVPELSTRLGRLGFTKPSQGGQLSVRHEGRVLKARYWISPAGFEERL